MIGDPEVILHKRENKGGDDKILKAKLRRVALIGNLHLLKVRKHHRWMAQGVSPK